MAIVEGMKDDTKRGAPRLVLRREGVMQNIAEHCRTNDRQAKDYVWEIMQFGKTDGWHDTAHDINAINRLRHGS
jgi:hypothetical protein